MTATAAPTTNIPSFSNCGPHTSQLIQILAAGKIGDILTDEALTAKIGRDVSPGEKGAGNLQRAVDTVSRAHGLNWKRVPGQGCIKCCDAEESEALSRMYRDGARRKARKGRHRLMNIDTEKLPPADASRVRALGAQLGALEIMGRETTVKKLEEKQATSEPDVKRLLEAWK
jgi:hypothetical protein